MNLQLKDKVVLVSGGAKGMGAAIVRACAGEGAIPVIVDRDAEAGQQLQIELRDKGAPSELILADLWTPEGCSQAVAHTVKACGRLDALVNNAGINGTIDLEHGSPEQFIASLGQDLLPYYNMTHYALPHLKQSQGPIVNISADRTASLASPRGAILALTREWAVELLGDGIRVNAIIPGRQNTAPDEIAAMAIFLISSNAAHITGQHLFVDSGIATNEGE
jgi:L-fucose dehydrogenase